MALWAPPAVRAMANCTTKLLLIGWHGANWKTIHPLIDAGEMPHLHSLIERGAVANVRTIGPADPAMLWTSISTGKTADQHGILSSLESDPISGRVRLTSGSNRSAKAVWNIAMQSGLTTHVEGWYAGYPAEELNGSFCANEFVIPTTLQAKQWPIYAGSLYPPSLANEFSGLRLHPLELDGNQLLPFIPSLRSIDAQADDRPKFLAEILAREISMHAIVTSLMQHQPWNLMVVGWHALGRACHRFMQYAPPRMPHISQQDCSAYGEIIHGMLRFEDMLLGRLVELAGADATIMIVSPAGFRSAADRPNASLQKVPSAWYRHQGVLCIAGPKIVKDELIHGVSLLDIAPTLLRILDIAPAEDMPGRVIAEAFAEPHPQDRVPSWEAIPGNCGMRQKETAADREAASAALAALLGDKHVSKPDSTVEALLARERWLNLALVHLEAGRYPLALPLLKELAGQAPSDARLNLWLAHCSLVCGDRNTCREALHRVTRPDLEDINSACAHLIETHLALLEQRKEDARSTIQKAERLGGDNAVVTYAAGLLYVLLKSWDEAERAFRHSITLDPAFQLPHEMLSRVLTVQGKNQEAADAALRSLEIDYASAFSHLALGLAMVGAGDGDLALSAFEKSAALNARSIEAQGWLAALRAEQKSRASITGEKSK
jgi:predicted AlkP superfamily phosphohydrolase/phosphomutase/tetratricopeptide (TPR) repeat protein